MQVKGVHDDIKGFINNATDGVNMICYSQGYSFNYKYLKLCIYFIFGTITSLVLKLYGNSLPPPPSTLYARCDKSLGVYMESGNKASMAISI